MSCKNTECEDYKDRRCCFECTDLEACRQPCEKIENNKINSDDYKKCEFYDSGEHWSWYQKNYISPSTMFDTKEEAIQDAINCKKEDIDSIYTEYDGSTYINVGKCYLEPLPTTPDVDRILEDLDEQYTSETGCDYYIYRDVTEEETKWLEEKFSELMNEFHHRIKLNPGWFKIIESEIIDLKEYMK